MTVYHIALFKCKPDIGPQELSRFAQFAKTMLGQIPGMLAVEFGEALEFTKPFTHGFDVGAVVTLSKPEDIGVFAKHPLHDGLMKLRDEFFEEDMLLLDFKF
ncbi:uncharacterized protein PV06_02412 [Exophiala oligosperma]|uniref:Stress-response A/B barrel domain-containing protein n=2 Tax=Chaetothyriales TaxID=34395 RepID=A0A0D2EFR1_9EURO|nr:uncharacterized protein PV06_02412 [Exophiala oligosperma]KAJ9640679.1 hypothetical protein H2204_003308 [Knufia peltigerae]KIW46774.1 hypothetical protein PV06_02412 [Exophiala oligosperma]